MRILKYFTLVLFTCSIFSCVSMFTKSPQLVDNVYDLFLKENGWLMLKSEKKALEEAKTDKEKEILIERFWKVRDPDTFTEKNEFRLSYEQNLIKARKDYPVLSDSRRYVYLLFGEPDSKYRFTNETVSIFSSFAIRIQIEQGEIWKYASRGRNFQIIFAKLNPYELQRAKDNSTEQNFSPISLYSFRFEILYAGPVEYIDISGFIRSFFQGPIRLKTTEETVSDLKKEILDRAEDFYQNKVSRVKRENYLYGWGKENIAVLIHPFEINSPNEVGVGIWLLLDKDTSNLRKKQYYSNLSLFCEIRNLSGNQVVYYQKDSVDYKLKAKEDYYYHFWGSVVPGKYKLILEIAENIGKRYKKYEVDIQTFDYSTSGLKAELMVGRIFEYSDNSFQGKLSYFSLKEGNFCPVFGNRYSDEFIFRESDEIIIIFDIAGFRKDNYGNSRVEISPSFTKGELGQDNKFIPTQGACLYRGQLLEKVDSPFRGIFKLKIADLVKERPDLSSGLYKVGLFIRDRVAGKRGEGTKEFFHPIQIQLKEK